MPTVITGTDGINQVQAGSIQSDDLSSGVGGVGTEIVPKTTSTNVSEVDIDLSGGAYNRVVIVVYAEPETDGVNAWLRVQKAGNSSPDSGAGYAYAGSRINQGSNEGRVAGQGSGRIEWGISGIGNAAGEHIAGVIFIDYPRDSNVATSVQFSGHFLAVNSIHESTWVNGHRLTAQDDDLIRLLFSSGNISSITYQVWGYE